MDIRTGERLTYADIAAYESVMQVSLTGVEIEALFAMDRGAQESITKVMKENTPNAG
jgi:hypothetical protein